MKRIICALLTFVFMISFGGATFAISENPAARKQLQAAPNAKTVELAFVFDGPSDKNAEVSKHRLQDHYYLSTKLHSHKI